MRSNTEQVVFSSPAREVFAPGAEVTAPTRIVPHGDSTVYVFTQLQAPEMPPAGRTLALQLARARTSRGVGSQ